MRLICILRTMGQTKEDRQYSVAAVNVYWSVSVQSIGRRCCSCYYPGTLTADHRCRCCCWCWCDGRWTLHPIELICVQSKTFNICVVGCAAQIALKIYQLSSATDCLPVRRKTSCLPASQQATNWASCYQSCHSHYRSATGGHVSL